MKFVNVFFLSAAALFFVSCGGPSTSQSTEAQTADAATETAPAQAEAPAEAAAPAEVAKPAETTTAAPAPAAAEGEAFAEFSKKFYADAAFQLSRVKFPVGEAYDGMDNSKMQYTKEDWTKISKQTVKAAGAKAYAGEWASDGGASGGSLRFEQIDGKWYLVKYNTYNN